MLTDHQLVAIIMGIGKNKVSLNHMKTSRPSNHEQQSITRVNNSIRNKIPPIRRENMQKKYPDWYHDFKSWKLF
jgi:hypothetical protein